MLCYIYVENQKYTKANTKSRNGDANDDDDDGDHQ